MGFLKKIIDFLIFRDTSKIFLKCLKDLASGSKSIWHFFQSKIIHRSVIYYRSNWMKKLKWVERSEKMLQILEWIISKDGLNFYSFFESKNSIKIVRQSRKNSSDLSDPIHMGHLSPINIFKFFQTVLYIILGLKMHKNPENLLGSFIFKIWSFFRSFEHFFVWSLRSDIRIYFLLYSLIFSFYIWKSKDLKTLYILM